VAFVLEPWGSGGGAGIHRWASTRLAQLEKSKDRLRGMLLVLDTAHVKGGWACFTGMLGRQGTLANFAGGDGKNHGHERREVAQAWTSNGALESWLSSHP